MIYTKYEWYRWKWAHYPELNIIKRTPIHIDIELTTRCNYACQMCEHSFNPPEPMDMSFKMAKKIIKQFAKGGGSSIKFVYLGEPLLYEKLPEVIQFAKKQGIIETMIATNASLLTMKKSAELIESGLDWVILSVDSCKPEIYKQIRVNGSLKIVARNIKNLYVVRDVLKSKTPKITIQVIRMNLNNKEIDSGEFEQFWKYYVDDIRISQLMNFKDINTIEEISDFCCTSPFRRITIRADGKIAVCCGLRSEAKIIGDIRKDLISDMWNGEKFNEIRKLMKEGKSHLIDICKNCSSRLNYINRGKK